MPSSKRLEPKSDFQKDLQDRYCQALAALLLLGLTLAGYWLFNQPPLLGHDDALFFSRGIDRFSVLEFAPHFPGYPGLIGLGRLALNVTDSAPQALLLVSRLSVLLLPLLVGWLLYSAGSTRRMALLGAIACLVQPLLLGLGPLGLSDAPGLAALLATLIGWLNRRDTLAGVLLALTLTIRPGYAPLIMGPLLWLALVQPHRIKPLLLPITIIGVLAFGFIGYHDGVGYITEGVRFIHGHFQIWGNTVLTQATDHNWFGALLSLFEPLPWLALLWLTAALSLLPWLWQQRRNSVIAIPASTLVAAICWTLPFQNPNNLRHLAPVLLLLLILFYLRQAQYTFRWRQFWLCLAPGCGLLLLPLQISGSVAPVQQAISFFSFQGQQQPTTQLLSSNHGVMLLRTALPQFAISDSFFTGSINRTLEHGGGLLSSTRKALPGYPLCSRFAARSPAEQELYLYSSNCLYRPN